MDKWPPIKAFILMPLQAILVIPAILLIFISEINIGWSLDLPYNTIPSFIGMLLIGIGLVLLIRSTILLATIGNGTLSPRNPTENLVVTGVYRYVRNPLVWGVLLTILGEAFLFGSPALFIMFIFTFIINHLHFTKLEEPEMSQKFGVEYQEYMKNVPRWIPRLKPWNGVSKVNNQPDIENVIE